MLALVATTPLSVGSCARYYGPTVVDGPTIGEGGPPLSIVYLVGDFGRPAAPFYDLVETIEEDVATAAQADLRTPPVIVELGDNLYENGLPHDLSRPGAQFEVAKLRTIAERLARIRYADRQVPIVLIPGNHDYRDNALFNDANLGDISRWYFLAELDIEGAVAWTHIPGEAGAFGSAAELYAHLDGDPEAHVAFMAPVPAPHLDPDLHAVAIDSELLIDLYASGREELAERYWERLGARLAELPGEQAWSFILTHHPPVTYGKHGRPSFGNWVFGQGWPQFPNTWQKALAFTVPIGFVLGIFVPAITPVSTAFVSGRKQDVGSPPYDAYADRLLELADEHDVDAIFAGHDHNTQIIELDDVDGYDDETLLVITGAGSKVDPVRRGDGTVAYLSNYSYVRMTQYADGLAFEIIDRSGTIRYRYNLPR